MFGDQMGFMEYRFSVLQRLDGRIEAATAVKYLKRFGHFYFASDPHGLAVDDCACIGEQFSSRRTPQLNTEFFEDAD